ncbi:MAG: orotidine-5'-phosphate decarboxylase [candidate division Zixibacteria bacterium]|nr:orotidine-5'-phosphate decarboxylase [candidate division Zixibacteria bacterium]
MSPFLNKLLTVVRKNNSLVCVGLDPDPDRFPEPLKNSRDAIYDFNRAIIEQTADIVCAYKLNLAFYEVQGPAGLEAMERTIRDIPKDVVVLGDAKRGDLDNTARMYARALFDHYGFDAATVNPYQGRDSVQPFLDYRDRGVFILCRTSNASAREFQDLTVNGHPLYVEVAKAVQAWNDYGNAGLVVGATSAESLTSIRDAAPGLPLLIPGIGAQGGDLASVIRLGADKHGEGLLINASRSILYASSGADFAQAARRAALALRDEINTLREKRKV